MINSKLSAFVLLIIVVGAVAPTFSSVLAKQHDETTPKLEKIVIVHHKEEAKPGGGGGKPGGDTGEYKLLARGFKWKTVPNFVLDWENAYGISENSFIKAFKSAVGEWDSHTGSDLYGGYSIDTSTSWDGDVPDGRNEILFGNYAASNVIAVTVIWGYFSGPVPSREIIEFDILLDTDFLWGTTGTSDLMDLQNILTHELGHGFGLGDLYNSGAINETMYGYSYEGDLEKRTLYYGDINGIQSLYGP